MAPRKGTVLSKAAKEKQGKAIDEWHRDNIENMSIGLQKGKRDAYKRVAERRNTSVSSMIQKFMDGESRKDFWGYTMLPEFRKAIDEELPEDLFEPITDLIWQDGHRWQLRCLSDEMEYEGDTWRFVIIQKVHFDPNDPEEKDYAEDIYAEAWKINKGESKMILSKKLKELVAPELLENKPIHLMVDCGKNGNYMANSLEEADKYHEEIMAKGYRYLPKESPVVATSQITIHYTSTTYKQWCEG